MTANLLAAWIGFSLGCLAGAIPGLFFHRDDWLGGYASWQRRMIRLAHIAFFGIGFLNLGFALNMIGNDSEALKMYNKALSIDPVNREAHLNLADFYCSQMNGRKAWGHIRFVQKLGDEIPGEQLEEMNKLCPEK